MFVSYFLNVEKKKISEEESVSTWQLLKIPEVFVVGMFHAFMNFGPVCGHIS